MTRADSWRKRPVILRYHEFKDVIRETGASLDESGMLVEFQLPMPPSWSARKRAELNGKPHQQKPDLDNLLKALMDALLPDDSIVWDIHARKVWGTIGTITLNRSEAWTIR